MTSPKPEAAVFSKSGVIKKYANRRLYHSGISAYVTFADLAGMVKEGQDFTVIDAKTGKDITRTVLMQIILEQEIAGRNLLPTNFMRQMIRFYGDSMQELAAYYLEFSMSKWLEEHRALKEKALTTFSAYPQFSVEEKMRVNADLFNKAMNAFMPFIGTLYARQSDSGDQKSILKDDLSLLEERLRKLESTPPLDTKEDDATKEGDA